MSEVGKIGFTIKEAAEYTRIGQDTMRLLINSNQIPVLRIGKKIVIRRNALDAFMLLHESRNLRDDPVDNKTHHYL